MPWLRCSGTPGLGKGRGRVGRDEDKDKDEDKDRPGKHDSEREGHVHEDTAKSIDPSQYGPPLDDDE
jgi:hypothetical protein